jgi:hypothetical protein
MKKLLGIVVLGLLISGNVYAKNPFLKGLDTFQFSVAEIDKCYVNTNDIETSAKYISLNSGINLIDMKSSWDEILQITAMIQDIKDTSPAICIGYLKIEAGRFVDAKNTKGYGAPAPVFFYDEAMMFGGLRDQFKNKLISNLEKMMKDFIIELKESQ